MTTLSSLLAQTSFSDADIVTLLGLKDPDDIAALREAAYSLTTVEVGDTVHYRGLVEVSNICALDCHYCGIRRGNRDIERYCLTKDDVVDAALWSAESGYGSCVLQAGERRDEGFIAFIESCVAEIKERSVSQQLPHGLGITLSLGEQTLETYRRWKAAGAHRYLLRIESSNPETFGRIHPPTQRFETRVAALADLGQAGYQVGTGVMIGLPGQTLADLAADIRFYASCDIDMIGMGPYIVASGNSMLDVGMMDPQALLGLSLRMIAVTRLVLRDVNIASTTALEALATDGRAQGIAFGANVAMPNLTPREVRQNYQLYQGKPGLDQAPAQQQSGLERSVEAGGRRVGWNSWGDPRHFGRRTAANSSG